MPEHWRRSVMLPMAVVTVGLSLGGCKKAEQGTAAPERNVEDWSLSQIEAELARNDDMLADAGIAVAAADIPTITSPSTPPGPEPTEVPDDDGGGDDGYDVGPVAEPGPEPEPMSEPEPEMAAMDEESDEGVAYAPLDRSSKRGRNRRERRRLSSGRDRRKDRAPSHCEKICDLAESTCDLEAQICSLARRHPEQPRYTKACTRAEQQCLAATDACNECEEC